MNRLLLSIFFLFTLGIFRSHADTNPFVTNPGINPAPIVGATPYATFTFWFGNSGSDAIPLLDVDGNPDPITVRISLARGVYDTDHYKDPVSAIGGDYKKYFSWTYNESTKTFTGTQILDLPAEDAGPITIAYKATSATTRTNANNGFNVNLAPSGNAPNGPGTNVTDDDNTYEYTFVDGALPVTLVQFDVAKEGNAARLNWATTEETNSDYFQVEHSIDAKRWAPIGKVKSHQESTVLRNYQYFHNSPGNGVNYYRLKMVDLDGTFAFSRVQSADFGRSGKDDVDLMAYPNPVTRRLFIKVKLGTEIRDLSIYSLSGSKVAHLTSMPTDGIDVSSYPEGTYIVNIKTHDGLQILRKVSVIK